MRKTPNPKYASVERPEIPLSGINAVNGLFLGQEYHAARNGNESRRIFIERKGVRRYMPESWLSDVLAVVYNG